MDLKLTEEQQSVREVFGGFFQKESPIERVRAVESLGFDPELWASLCKTGATVMGLPPEHGGGGATTLDLVLVAQEFGRRIAAVPLTEAVAATDLLAQTDVGRTFIDQVADATLLPTLALRPLNGSTAKLAPAGAIADLIVALEGDELVAVRRSGDRPYATPPRNLASAPVADWDLSLPGQVRMVLARGSVACALHASAVSLWRLLTAASLMGLQAEALEIGVNYVKTREAFGRPIGYFQTIQHRLADVATTGDGVELLVYEAGWTRDNDPERAGALADMAFLAAADVAFRTCRESLQFHGGYGYTLEYDIQMYFRRAKAWPLAGGPIREVYQQLASSLWDTPTSASSSQGA